MNETEGEMTDAPDKATIRRDHQIAELIQENARLRGVVRVNLLRLAPGISHEAIDAIIDAVIAGGSFQIAGMVP